MPRKATIAPAVQRGLATYLPDIGTEPDGRAGVLVPLGQITNVPASLKETRYANDPDGFEEFCASIREHGLENPIHVVAANGHYEIRHGRHRAFAFKALGLAEIPAIVRQDLDAQRGAVATIIENAHRRDPPPYEYGLQLQAALDTGLTQAELATRIGRSVEFVRARLDVVALGPDLGPLVGDVLTLGQGQWLSPLGAHPDLAARVAKEARRNVGGASFNDRCTYLVETALCSGKDPVACAPYSWQFLERIRQVSVSRWQLEEDATFKAAIGKLRTVRFGSAKNPDLVICLDVQEAKACVEEAVQRLHAKNAAKDRRHGATSRHGKDLAKQRLARATRQVGLELMVKHVASRTSFSDDLTKLAYKRLLVDCGQVAATKEEQAALKEVLGDHAPRDVSRGLPDLVDQLWTKDRLCLDRYMACVVFLRDRESSPHSSHPQWRPRDADVARLATGNTGPQIAAAAKKRATSSPAGKKAKATKKATKRKAKAEKPSAPTTDDEDEEA